MALVAGIFLVLFGAAMLFWLPRQFPNAKVTRIAYAWTTAGGAASILFALTHLLIAGVVAVIFILIGSIFGIVGWARKELRVTL